ncbi:hypothetical protein JOQ06_023648, partial [Pogonophryne albipinna]
MSVVAPPWLLRGTVAPPWLLRGSSVAPWLLRGSSVAPWPHGSVALWLLRGSSVAPWQPSALEREPGRKEVLYPPPAVTLLSGPHDDPLHTGLPSFILRPAAVHEGLIAVKNTLFQRWNWDYMVT